MHIVWRDTNADWPWFYLLDMRNDWLHLQGADYPDGSAQHEGDTFWVHRSDVVLMAPHTKRRKSYRRTA